MQLYAISLQFTTNFRFLDVVSGFMSKQQSDIELILVNRLNQCYFSFQIISVTGHYPWQNFRTRAARVAGGHST